MERRKQFKLLSVMLAAVTLMALLAGCAPVAPAAPAPAQPAATSAAGQAAPAATAATGAPATGNQPVELTFWWWAESDAPGADKWLEETIAAYQKAPPEYHGQDGAQSTDTLISAFTAAAVGQVRARPCLTVGDDPGALAGVGRGGDADQRPGARR